MTEPEGVPGLTAENWPTLFGVAQQPPNEQEMVLGAIAGLLTHAESRGHEPLAYLRSHAKAMDDAGGPDASRLAADAALLDLMGQGG